MTAKTWLITGTSSGLGQQWALAALERGDQVAGTARDLSRLADLADAYPEQMLPLAVDVNDRNTVVEAVNRTHAHFGALDVVVNNAGYGHLGAVEEVPEDVAREQFDTNFFGALWVTQAALPLMRAEGGGHIIQVSSVAGVSAVPLLSLYSASKWALEGMSEALAGEVARFGIKVTIVEPGGYRTAAGSRPGPTFQPIDAYQPMREQHMQYAGVASQGDPEATRSAILEIVDAEDPPLRLVLGSGLLDNLEVTYASRLRTWREWAAVSEAAQGEPAS